MLNNKQNENSHGARKIIGILSMFLLPIVSFAHGYGYKMMNYGNGGYGYSGFESDYSMLGLMSFLFIVPTVGIIVVIALFIFWLMMLIDAIKHSPEKMKIVWVLVIIFAQIIGALVYYFIEKRPRDKMKKEHHTEYKKEVVE